MPKRLREQNRNEDLESRNPAEIFADLQEVGSYLTEKLLNELENFYHSHADEPDLFENYFYGPILVVMKGSFSSSYVKKLVGFISEFLTNRMAEEDEDEDRESMSPFVTSFFKLIWLVQSLDDKNLRYNSCKILAILLAKLAEKDISMDETLCEKISDVMIADRITDKAVDIRELAAKVMQWLQDGASPTCPVTKTLLYHLEKDPSVEVRKTILSIIRVSSITLPSIIKRTRDVNESVRVMAFKILAERRRLNSLSYSLREKIIMSGLEDASPAVRDMTENLLLPKWLENLQGDLVAFIDNLDVHFRPSVPRRALPFLFRSKTPEELIDILKLSEGERYPAPENLTAPLALYWASLAKYFKDEDMTEHLEKILGTVSELTLYVNCFYKQEIPKDKEVGENEKEEKVYKITILLFLLDLFSFCDMADEAGRANMTEVLLDILKSDDHKPDRRLLTKVTAQLSVGMPDPFTRVETVTEMLGELYNPYVQPQMESSAPALTDEQKRAITLSIAHLKMKVCNLQITLEKAVGDEQFTKAEEIKQDLSKLREELKNKEDELKGPVVLETQDEALERQMTNDRSIQYKCLVILCELLKNEDVFQATIGFADIIEHFVLEMVKIDEEHLIVNSLEALGLYSMHADMIATKHLPMFYVMLINDIRPYESVKAKCLACILQLMIHHGPEKLEIPPNEWIVTPEMVKFDAGGKESQQMGYLDAIIQKMNSENDMVKKHAIVGACQLMLSGRISSSHLLAKVILLWFLPSSSSNNYLVKLIGQFLSHYAAENHKAPQLLADALIEVVDTIINSSHSSDLQELDAVEVGLFILDLTKPGTNKYTEENQHNSIARLLLEKLEFEDNAESQTVLLRLLVNLAISIEEDKVRKPLLETIRRVKANNLADSKNKDLLRLMLNLQARPTADGMPENVSSTPRSPTNRRTLFMDKENMITPIRGGDESDQDMDSDDDFKTPLIRPIRN